ncbi:MAG TPA: xanthine dehydrogenase family protein molybdopterin-binding subunit, partial [Chloroflexota bacterium]|nr:xanthine dehydrogenase family protein molybdopterin-binding subunit [Chloroflexota bacterium]
SLLFDTTLRYIGEEVAAVAAVSEEIAEDALRLIDIEYERLPFVTDFMKALEPDSPRLRPDSKEGRHGNLQTDPQIYERGDVEAGFRDAEVMVDEVFTTQTALHNCLEPHGCVASWEGDRLTLWESTQSIFDVRKEVAEKLELSESKVRVIKQYMGGGFGSKQIAWKPTVMAALLSKAADRPVQLMLDREAENLAAGNRNPTRQRVKIGARRDGTITALSVKIEQSVGAHMTGGEGSNTPGLYQRLYKVANLRTEQLPIYANTGPAVAFRAPGYVEAAYALEQAMDMLSRALKMDPLDLRLKNYAETDQKRDKPFTVPQSLRLCYEKAGDAFGWRGYQKPTIEGPKRRGIGMAAHEWGGSGYPPGYAWVKLNADGTADVVTGTQDIGTGTRTSLTQVAAEELGLPMSQVRLHLGDTGQGPYAPVSSGSATQATIGPAIRDAADAAKKLLLQAAGTYLEVDPMLLRVQDGAIFVEGEGGHAATVAEVTQRIAPHMIQGHGVRGPNPEDKSVRTFGAQFVEVEVDTESGEVTVLRVVASHDCGKIVNPTLVDSQVIGAVTQGIGFALTEERVIDHPRGIVLNANLEEYKVPTVLDVPPITNVHVDLADPDANVTGSKGIGEPPLVPTAPAIANAIYDATGIRVKDGPISRHKLIALLAAQATHTAQEGAKR